MYHDIARVVAQEYSGHRAKDYCTAIHSTDRYSSFPLYRRTAAYCYTEMQCMGLSDAELLPCNADGRTPYGDWLVPRAWEPREAQLSVLGSGHVLARYPDEPVSLAMYSAATPPEGIRARVVPIERAAECVAGSGPSLVLADRFLTKAERRELATRGIVGVVTCRGHMDLPDMRRWDNYQFAPRNEEGLFGFSLSFRECEYLRGLCARGPVKLDARVDATLYDGVVENVTARIPGEGEEEVLVLAHLYEEGANDNASGAGASLEAMRCLKTLIDRGDLPRPARSIRVLLGFECCGFMAYVMGHPERMARTVAAINPDMVGEEQTLCRSSFALHLTPGAAPSCVDALALALFDDLARDDVLFRWRPAPYTICDSFVGDPTIGVPSVSIIGIPDRYYHSSMDTPDKVSAETLGATGGMVATYLYSLANAGPGEACWLAEAAAARGRKEIETASGVLIDRLVNGACAEVLGQAKGRLPFLAARHGRAVASALRFGRSDGLAAKVARLERGLGEVAERALADVREAARDLVGCAERASSATDTPATETAARLIPKRLVPGPLTLEPLLLRTDEPLPWAPSWSAPHNDVLIWADGQRSIAEIVRCARFESPGRPIDPEEMISYFQFLAANGYVALREV